MIDGRTFQEINKGTGALIIDDVAAFLVSQFEKPTRQEKAHV
jgi:hypothetical protein